MDFQNTIKDSTPCIEGVNIITGNKNKVRFHPGDADTGVVFYSKGESIRATLENAFHYKPLRGLGIASCIGLKGNHHNIGKVEHLLATVYSLGIDNLIIELSDGMCPRQDIPSTEIVDILNDYRVQTSKEREYFTLNDKLSKDKKTATFQGVDDRISLVNSRGFFYKLHCFLSA